MVSRSRHASDDWRLHGEDGADYARGKMSHIVVGDTIASTCHVGLAVALTRAVLGDGESC